MSPGNGSGHSWGFFAVAILTGVVALSFGFGFVLLPKYQGTQGPYSAKDSLYHALGLHTHGKELGSVQPPLKVPTYIAWTDATIQQAMGGDAKRGEFIALNCNACHVEQAKSTEPWIPILAGLDRLVTYKQLDDFRSGTRLSGPMSAIAQSLTPQDYADVAAYYASQPGMPENTGERMPHSHRTYRNADPLQRLIFAGDPKRGIAACASCHGPGGYLIGAPALSNQNAVYLGQQLQAFAQGTRANDMNMPMRTIAGLLTPEEMKSLASAYAKGLAELK
jgi:cytochrome c553